jgi:S1-C subfamily serine protease
MKYSRYLFVGLLLLSLSDSSLAADEDTLKLKVASSFEKLIAVSKIQEPPEQIVTRSSGGSKYFRETSNGIVLVFTANNTMGSGVVLSNSGLIVTNWHVVENEPQVGIIFNETIRQDKTSLKKEDIFIANVLRTDPVKDLALLQMVSLPRDLTVLRLGSMSQVEVGQDVFAIGHPEGLLWSYTEGVVSQIRSNYLLKTDSGSTHRATYIQTQAVVSHGSSGGALFDYNGQLIGIIAATLGPGLNFAIAVSDVEGFVKSALEKPFDQGGRGGPSGMGK